MHGTRGLVMSKELKACLNCGYKANIAMNSAENGEVRVYCAKCGTATTWRESFDQAARAWNKRRKSYTKLGSFFGFY